MSQSRGFHVDWYSGASAQLELLLPRQRTQRRPKFYDLKYTPPYRTTIRPPIEENSIYPESLKPIGRALDEVTTTLAARTSSRAGSTRASRRDTAAEDNIKRLGNQLYELLVPKKFQGDLRNKGLFLEIGMDDRLLDFPWELIHDGDDFLCLKHYLGRFVNESMHSVPLAAPYESTRSSFDKISVLVVSVPDPPRDVELDELPGAEAETYAICEALDGLKKRGVRYELLKDEKATYNNVWDAFKKQYQIIHFIGHAHYNEEDPLRSGLVLHDRNMSSKEVATCFGRIPPVLCFMNACETARTGSPGSRRLRSSQNIYGLAEAFLRTGTYLLGSRWKLGDNAAVHFSSKFYSSLLGDEKSIGNSITEARQACKKAAPEDPFSWASYIFYGDPRLYFRAFP